MHFLKLLPVPVLQKFISSLSQIYSKGNFKYNIIVIQESNPRKFQEHTRIKTRELVLEEQCKNVR